MFEVLPGAGRRVFHDPAKPVYAWGPFRKTATGENAQGDGWSRYNFLGYEGRPQYPEYYDVVQTMADIGRERGCGRVTWENNGDNGQYGTTMALMLLPHWTDGCMASMEGLFFEASGTTPYHFLDDGGDVQAELQPGARAALRQQRRRQGRAVPAGARRPLRDGAHGRGQALGRGAAGADAAGDERTVGDLRGRRLRRSSSRSPCSPSSSTGATATSASATSSSARAGSSTATSGPRCRPTTGPTSWQRIHVDVDQSRVVPDPNRSADDPDTRGKQVDIVVPREAIEPVALPPVTVSDVVIDEQDLSFTRRPGRRPGAGQGVVLPELDGPRRRGSVPHRAEPDGRRADVGAGRR